MHFTIRNVIPAAALALVVGASPLMAQQAPEAPAAPQQQPAAQEAKSVQGELTRVDAATKMLWVRVAGAEQPQQFRFTDDTEIAGEGRSVEGLATMTGTTVKVEYKAEGTANVATKIEIQARDAASPEARPQQ